MYIPACSFPWLHRWNAPAQPAAEVEKILAATRGVKYTTTVVSFNLLSFAQTTYNASFFVTFKHWDPRKTRDQQFQAIKNRLNRELIKFPAGYKRRMQNRPVNAV